MTEHNEKLIQAKERAARRASDGSFSRPRPAGDGRLPPGQYLVTKFPVLDLGVRKPLSLEEWQLQLSGLAERTEPITWAQLRALPRVELVADFHCVTRWSLFDMRWAGVRFRDLLELVRPLPEARFVMQYGRDGYSTNLPLEVLLDDDVLLAYELGGEPISLEHGGPVRTIVPKRYAWKGAKYLSGIELMAEDRPGFWEQRGYHNAGDPWKEERYW